MAIKIALAGNPNCGKTTMFNDLTGSNQFVGNWPGVTVEKKEGRLKGHKDVIITDLRGVDPIYSGNRFMIYSMYPEQNISVWIVSGKGGQGCSCAVGYSILNRTSNVDVGSLMLKYGGGGHKAVGTCQFTNENMDEKVPLLLDEIINYK